MSTALRDKVIEVLKGIYDPEIPVNIYEIGLIYEVNVDDEANVHVLMTLTSPMCPVAESLPPEVEEKVWRASHRPRSRSPGTRPGTRR
jgi:metal-sulfur cluster biosynthetic enzyme